MGIQECCYVNKKVIILLFEFIDDVIYSRVDLSLFLYFLVDMKYLYNFKDFFILIKQWRNKDKLKGNFKWIVF